MKRKIFKVGVFGSNSGGEAVRTRTRKIGELLGLRKMTVVTGACSGLPYEAAHAARRFGSRVIGFSPHRNLAEQKRGTPNDDLSIYSKIEFMPRNFPFLSNKRVCMKYRNVSSTATVDAGIVISGRWGSLNEFTNLYDMEKVIGVLTGTGGIADEIRALQKKIHKPGNAVVVYDSSPVRLVEKVVRELRKRSS